MLSRQVCSQTPFRKIESSVLSPSVSSSLRFTLSVVVLMLPFSYFFLDVLQLLTFSMVSVQLFFTTIILLGLNGDNGR